ncbi:SGNH/GDSL hydrolase family protein [Microbacterium atlanticum]|uniref:SGNH/GDSL hydrolase family protein n=1 Tax=Microbacterium atlanticum TaxID=2782168 RepID=UPI00188827ED|nr:SGNH/GDSL hydrolase family protein [Microbacterium atlanticum]
MKRRILAVLAAVAVGAGLVAAGGSAAAAPTTVAKYVALGDSIAAGQGGGVPLDACARTDGGYASQLDDVPKVNLLRHPACSGATIGDTAAQLSQVNRGTTLVTLTVGANDLGLDTVYAQCATVPAGGDLNACLMAVQTVIDDAPGLVQPLAMLIGAIAQRAPNATIVVTGYPHLLEPVDVQACALVAPVEQCLALAALAQAVNTAADALNAAIQAAVAMAAANGANVVYADVVQAFLGHGVQLLPGAPSDPWFGVDPVNDPAGFLHPTYEGYAAYTQVILSKLNP